MSATTGRGRRPHFGSRAILRRRVSGRLALAVLIAVLGMLATAAGANAAYLYFLGGPGTYVGQFNQTANSYPYYAALYETSSRAIAGTACVAALNLDGSQAGSVACSSDLATHPFNGQTPRYGFSRTLVGAGATYRARMDY